MSTGAYVAIAAVLIAVAFGLWRRRVDGRFRAARPVEGPLTLSALVDRVVAAHPGGRLPQVLEACSVLVGDRPVKSLDPATVMVQPGDSVEFLPPFAGG